MTCINTGGPSVLMQVNRKTVHRQNTHYLFVNKLIYLFNVSYLSLISMLFTVIYNNLNYYNLIKFI